MISYFQQTLNNAITLHGVGVHSGLPVELCIKPAPLDHGIIFYRSDISDSQPIPALYHLVTDTRMSTTLTNQAGHAVSTVEHLMAALSGSGITNCAIYVSGPEIPIMDGSSHIFSRAIAQIGLCAQQAEAPALWIEHSLKIETPNSWVKIDPSPYRQFTVTFDLYQKLPQSMQQTANVCFNMSRESFSDTIAHARTFGLYDDAQKIQAAGLAKGASLDNTIIIYEEGVMNEGGLRHPDELAQHKILDAVGDLALSSALIIGAYSAYNGSHDLNNQLMRKIFSAHEMHFNHHA